jgi:hypothetical protein
MDHTAVETEVFNIDAQDGQDSLRQPECCGLALYIIY